MQLGTELKDHYCARCYERISPPFVYQDGLWLHLRCFQEGARQLANAMRLANSFRESERPMSPTRLLGG